MDDSLHVHVKYVVYDVVCEWPKQARLAV